MATLSYGVLLLMYFTLPFVVSLRPEGTAFYATLLKYCTLLYQVFCVTKRVQNLYVPFLVHFIASTYVLVRGC